MLKITEIKNDKMSVVNTPNNLDKPLTKDDLGCLPNYSGFSMMVVGSSGSGKTTLLYSMMTKPKKTAKPSHTRDYSIIFISSARRSVVNP